MTVSSTTNSNTYTGNGAVSVYAYSFKIFADTDLLITVRDTSDVETTLTLTTDYTVSDAGETSGGNVTLVNAGQSWLTSGNLKSSYELIIRRVLPLKQTTDIRNQGAFYPEAHENQFDKLVMISQQQQNEIDRSVKNPESVSTTEFDPTLPSDIATADRTIVTNANGDGFELGPTATEVSNAQTYANNASTSATAAAASAAAALSSENAASTSASNASTSESNASTSASNAASSASSASSSASAASSSASAASASESNAATSASNAATSESNAATSETNAATSASNASTSETNAATSATNAATSATNAATSETNALAAASSRLYRQTNFVDNGDSPVTVANTDIGILYSIDCAAGNVVLNLPAISTLSLMAPIAFKKTDSSANTATINRGGTDTIGGATSFTLSSTDQGVILAPEDSPSPDTWTPIDFASDTTIVVTTATKSTTYTATTADKFIPVTTASSWTLSLYGSSGNNNREISVLKTSSDYNPLTISPDGSDTINGTTSFKLNTEGEFAKFKLIGTNWYLIEHRIPSYWQSFSPTVFWTTNATTTGRWMRIKDNIWVIINIAMSGANTQGSLTATIPHSLSMDTSKLISTSDASETRIGSVAYYDADGSGTKDLIGHLRYASTTTLIATCMPPGNASDHYLDNISSSAAFPVTVANGDIVKLEFMVPIADWEG